VSHRKQRKSTRNLQGIGLAYEFRRRIIKGSDLGHRPLAFINERRAINLDPNCGWARGKTDVLYIADAFQVISKLNALLAEKSEQQSASTSG
jgi:hypothetical protein